VTQAGSRESQEFTKVLNHI